MNDAAILERYSRRGLWTLLILLIATAAGAALLLTYPAARKLSYMLPIAIAIAAAALRSSARGVNVDPSSPGMKAVITDELRQHSMHRAFRNAFFAILVAQPLLAFAPQWFAIAYPAAFMAAATIWIGMVAMLASLLFHDR